MNINNLRGKKKIGVIGGSSPSEEYIPVAKKVGREIARNDALLICGGKTGVMKASAQGAKEEGGITIGIMPEATSRLANKFIDIPISTGLGHMRNNVIVYSSDGLIAIDGAYGTLSEVTFSLLNQKPIVSIDSWKIKGVSITEEEKPKKAVNKLLKQI